MKKLIIILLTLWVLFGCTEVEEPTPTPPREYDAAELLMLEEMENSFNFFWEQANTDEESGGYGLINDRYPSNVSLSSIASVGFGLAGIPIGIEYEWITYDAGFERAEKTLDTFLAMDHYQGFFYHFLNKQTGERAGTSEVSIIDTALFIAGALTAGEYFGGDVKEKAEDLYERIDWTWYLDPSRNMFYMGYQPGGGFAGHWDFYGEQLILYVLGAGAPNEAYRTDQSVYNTFIRRQASYGGGETFISSWFGSLFTYQYSHAFIDFRNREDAQGVNWFENSINATIANRKYAIDSHDTFQTFTANSWGMTASDGPRGYNGYYGSKPSGYTDDAHRNDGTIAPAGALGSVVFTPDLVKGAIQYFETIGGLKGEYGYKDAYNFDQTTPWIAGDIIGIDKGITLLMIGNYFDDIIWEQFMKNEYVNLGLERIGILPVESSETN
ncbi:MAG: hypothetical protein C4537_05485 [Acholeplasma sp.]|jgi:hypothetical protein|nr:MAG: hypothetical protein C4537_05485 [Acholeplasma sp.]